MNRDQQGTEQAGGAYPAWTTLSDYDALRLLGIRLIDAIARLLRAGKEHD